MLLLFQLFLVHGNKVGDVYYVESNSSGYVWINDNGVERWEQLGMTIDTSNFITKNGLLATLGNSETNTIHQKGISDAIDLKQDILRSGQNIKTINNLSIVGSGNIEIAGGNTNATTFQLTSNYAIYSWCFKIGNMCFISGTVYNSGGTYPKNQWHTIATVPTNYKPKASFIADTGNSLLGISTGTSAGNTTPVPTTISINNNGEIQVYEQYDKKRETFMLFYIID